MNDATAQTRPAPHVEGFRSNTYQARFIEDIRVGDRIFKNDTYVYVTGVKSRTGAVYTVKWAYRADATKHVGFHVGRLGEHFRVT